MVMVEVVVTAWSRRSMWACRQKVPGATAKNGCIYKYRPSRQPRYHPVCNSSRCQVDARALACRRTIRSSPPWHLVASTGRQEENGTKYSGASPVAMLLQGPAVPLRYHSVGSIPSDKEGYDWPETLTPLYRPLPGSLDITSVYLTEPSNPALIVVVVMAAALAVLACRLLQVAATRLVAAISMQLQKRYLLLVGRKRGWEQKRRPLLRNSDDGCTTVRSGFDVTVADGKLSPSFGAVSLSVTPFHTVSHCGTRHHPLLG